MILLMMIIELLLLMQFCRQMPLPRLCSHTHTHAQPRAFVCKTGAKNRASHLVFPARLANFLWHERRSLCVGAYVNAGGRACWGARPHCVLFITSSYLKQTHQLARPHQRDSLTLWAVFQISCPNYLPTPLSSSFSLHSLYFTASHFAQGGKHTTTCSSPPFCVCVCAGEICVNIVIFPPPVKTRK